MNNTEAQRPRYYVAAHGFGWGVHDSAQGEHPHHPRIEHFATIEHVDWQGAQRAAQARCDELNASEATA